MSLKCDLSVVERKSKRDFIYTIVEIKIYCPQCNCFVEISDFNTELPVGLQLIGQDVTIKTIPQKEGVPIVYIVELGYTIPWKYRMAITLLANHKCLQF